MLTPHRGGRVRKADTFNTRWIWRCSHCGLEAVWCDSWGGYWSMLQEENGLFATDMSNHIIWCSPSCEAALAKHCEPLVVKPSRKRGSG